MPDKTINNIGGNSEIPKNCCDSTTQTVRELTLTDKINKKLAMSLLQRMNNSSDSQIQQLIQKANETDNTDKSEDESNSFE